MRVLLVEDNALNMEIAQFLLETAGAVVTRAWNGREAVDAFAAQVRLLSMQILLWRAPLQFGCRTLLTCERAESARERRGRFRCWWH